MTSGFAAEWVLLQSLIHGDGADDQLVAVALPITVSVVALTAGLALLTFVKAYGIAFLARPRSEGAAHAHEANAPDARGHARRHAWPWSAWAWPPDRWPRPWPGAVGASGVEVVGMLGVSLPAVSALLDPVALVLLAAVVAVPVVVAQVAAARRAPRRDVELAWGCGGIRVSPTMQYTATSYAEPLVRVFDDALQPRRDLQVTHADESRYLVSKVRFRQRVSDVVADRIYDPVVAGAR